MKHRFWCAATVLWVCGLAACGFSSRASAAPVAMACGVKGAPEVKSGGSWRPLNSLQRLEAGDVVRCGAGEETVVVLFGNGGRFKVGAGGQATIGAASVAGATALGGANGPSARAARALSGARVGAVMGRPATSHQRLSPDFKGFVVAAPDGSWRAPFLTTSGAAAYGFSLIDGSDNVVRSEQLGETATEIAMPAGELQLRRAYTWQMTAFGKSGKPLSGRWGVITFLNAADAAALEQSAAPLREEARLKPADATPHALLAELFRSYGVLERTLEEIDALDAPDALQLQRETYRQIGPYAFGRWLLLQDDKTLPDEAETMQ